MEYLKFPPEERTRKVAGTLVTLKTLVMLCDSVCPVAEKTCWDAAPGRLLPFNWKVSRLLTGKEDAPWVVDGVAVPEYAA